MSKNTLDSFKNVKKIQIQNLHLFNIGINIQLRNYRLKLSK